MKKILLVYSIITSSIVFNDQLPLKQGITGKIYLRMGNNMPVPGQKTAHGKPVNTEVFVYELTTRDQATENGTYYSHLKTKLVAKAQSDSEGNYEIMLPPGNYSVFVIDNDQLYANSFDGKGSINPVTVKKDSLARKDIMISSKAFY